MRPDLDLWIARLYKRKSEIYRARVIAAITLRAGVARLIGELQQAGIRLAIANDHGAVQHSQPDPRQSGRSDYAEPSEDRCRRSPDQQKTGADVYQRVLQRLGLLPEACLAIEDSSIGLGGAPHVCRP